ncbi:ADAM 17-like protease [Littorina saxatilis]|uniref:ADAM 17-like protease n=1 Tax=Littorina saxatilis TaxID=31220 RepID=UPI0038B4E857
MLPQELRGVLMDRSLKPSMLASEHLAGSTVLSPHFRAVTVDEHGNNEPFYVNPNDFYTGHLAEDSSVTVNAHFEDGILSSSINFQHDTYMVEPAWRHHKPSDNFTMISYRGSDVNWDEILPIDPETGKRTKMKDGIRLPEGSARNTQQSYGQNATNMGGNSRHKRGAVFKNTCPLLVVADYYFFRDMGNRKRQTTASFLMKIHVKFASVQGHYNADHSWHYNEKLYAFSRSPQNNLFCLAHLFTSYPMADNVLGLAFIAPESVASAGGICSTGHNWGAEHDADDVDECNPGSNGKYVMWPYAVPGYEENNQFFSPCSKRGIAPVLRSKSGYCFRNVVEKENTVDPSKDEGKVKSLCGNGIVEENEECDIGFPEEDVEDKCCNRDCKFKPGAQCSDFNSPCCKECFIASSSVVCEEKNELACKGEAFCDGKTLNCSAPSLLSNTPCIDKGQCYSGRCLNFCQLRGLSESKTLKPCLCTQNTTAMCRRCCLEIMQNDTKGECLPTAVLQEDGRTCATGTCDEGVCAKIEQDLAHRIFKFIKFLTADSLVEFMRTNIVGTVIVLSLLIWIPASWIVSCVDKRQVVENENDLQRWLSRERSLMGIQRDQMKDFVIKNSRFTSVLNASHINGTREQNFPSASTSSKRVTFRDHGITGEHCNQPFSPGNGDHQGWVSRQQVKTTKQAESWQKASD